MKNSVIQTRNDKQKNMKTSRKYIKNLSILCLSMFVLSACSKDDDNNSTESSAKEITAFIFLAADNEVLSEDVKATIDMEKKTISAKVPLGTALTALKPTITVSDKASVNPKDKAVEDFSGAVEYTVTAEDGSTTKYTVTVMQEKSSIKVITAFEFLAKDNASLSDDVSALIIMDSMTIRARVPDGADISNLKPTITVSEGASVSPEDKAETDFSEAVTYTVTAEDGSTAEYTVELARRLSEKEALEALYRANPFNDLDWDLTKEPSEWEGVVIEDNKVVGLNIQRNALSIIPVSFGDLVNLRELALWENNIKSLPAEMGNLKNLNSISLSSNSLESIPKEMGTLTNLKNFFINNNSLESIPSELGALSNLERLELRNNPLKEIPEGIGGLQNLRELVLTNCSLENLPIELGNLSSLEKLDLSNNDLTSVPAELGNLANLEELFLNNNTLTTVPAEVGNLGQLQRFSLTRNELTSIPETIGNLTNLIDLYLGENNLVSVPAELGNLANLEELFLNDNLLTTIPGEIGTLGQLQRLSLARNELTMVPAAIGDLINLRDLYLSENELASIPSEIGRLGSLRDFYLLGNPLTTVPKEICDMDISDFRKDPTQVCEE